MKSKLPGSNVSVAMVKKGHQMPKDEVCNVGLIYYVGLIALSQILPLFNEQNITQKELRSIFKFYSKHMSLRNIALEQMADVVEIHSISKV